jgi:uncharacterized protein YjbJ (UPF0337 family)
MTRCFTKTYKYLPGHRPNGENRVQRRIHALHVLAESQSDLNVGNQGGSCEVGAFGSIGVAHPDTEIGQREIAPSQFELCPGALERQTAPASISVFNTDQLSRIAFHRLCKRRVTMKTSSKDGIKGKIQEVKGKLKAIAGRATRNPDLEAEGQAQEAIGRIQQKVGQVKKVFGK